jgi:hypothetical protein
VGEIVIKIPFCATKGGLKYSLIPVEPKLELVTKVIILELVTKVIILELVTKVTI